MSGAGGRHIAEWRSRRPRARHDHCRALPPGDVRVRQRNGVHQHGDAALVAGTARRMALHRARQAAAECLRGIAHRTLARRMPERETLFTSLLHARAVLADWKDEILGLYL